MGQGVNAAPYLAAAVIAGGVGDPLKKKRCVHCKWLCESCCSH